MAVVQFTGIVNQIRGKLNGSVFNRARSVNTLQRKQQAPRRQVGFSSEPRNLFSVAQRSWAGLTGTQRQQWALAAANNPSRNRFGELVALAGYNQYVKAYMLATYAGVTPPVTPVTSAAPSPDVTFASNDFLGFDVAANGNTLVNWEVVVEANNPSPDFRMLIDVTLPQSPGVTVNYKRFTHVGAFEVPATDRESGTTDLGDRYPLPQAGQYVFFRMRVVYVPNGAIVYEAIQRLVV